MLAYLMGSFVWFGLEICREKRGINVEIRRKDIADAVLHRNAVGLPEIEKSQKMFSACEKCELISTTVMPAVFKSLSNRTIIR